MSSSIPSKRSQSMGYTPRTNATGHASGTRRVEDPPEDPPRRGGGGSMPDLPPVMRHGAISPPGGMPTITLVNPSYKEACAARDASRTRFEQHIPGSDLSESTVRNDTKHLGQTVVTVRHYLDASNTATSNEIENLSTTFRDSTLNGSDITAPLQTLDRLLAKADHMISEMLDTETSETTLSEAKLFIQQALSHRNDANNPAIAHEVNCESAGNATRLLGYAMSTGFETLERHMLEAENNHRDMVGTIAAKPANLLNAESSSILRSLDHVLQHGTHTTTATNNFDMDGFIQLLYSEKEIGLTFASAMHYTANGPDIGRLVDTLSGTDLHPIADQVAAEMFGASSNHINIGTYLETIVARADIATPHIPNAEELLREALKHIRPGK